MSIRISDNGQYNSIINNLYRIRSEYSEVMDKLSSQKNITKISDDALGITQVLGYKQTNLAITQYSSNVEAAGSWLTATESALSSANDMLAEARSLAVSQATATATSQTRKINASKIEAIMEEMLSLANSKLGDRYLFAGSRSDVKPFASEEESAKIADPVAGGANVYEGNVTQSGAYAGDTNKTYVLKISTGGDQTTARYKISSDGGKTWGAESAAGDIDNPVSLGDGVTLTFDDGSFAVDDVFYVHAYTSGYYQGNGDELSVSVNRDSSASYSISGAEAFTDQGKGSIDIFKAMKNLKDSLESNDVDGIRQGMEDMQKAGDQISLCVAKCGSRANRMEMAKNNLADLDLNMTTLISTTEDADIAELAIKFSMKEVALQSVYEVASRISSNSIIQFLK